MKNLVTIIVPVFNVERYLKKCIESILHQTYRNLEIILVDDGSTDRSSNICDEYAEKYENVKVIHKRNGGLSDARNSGIHMACGDYLMFIDSDDYIDSTMVEKMFSRIKEDQSDMVICGFEYVDEKGKYISSKNHFQDEVVTKDVFWHRMYNGYYTECVVAWNKLYTRIIFDELRYDLDKVHEDEFIIHKLINNCDKISFMYDKLYFYLQRQDGITRSLFSLKRLDAVEALIIRTTYFLDKQMYDYAEKSLLASKAFFFKGYDQLSKEEMKSEKVLTLKKMFDQSYKKIIFKKISMRSKIILTLFYLHPKVYAVIYRKYKKLYD